EDITDPTTAMNMALALMAKIFKLNYSTPTNNNQRISSNPRNMQIAQPGNLNGYNAVQNVGNQVAQNPRVQNDGFQNQNGNDGSAEVHENYDNNEIFNLFTQKEQYTELLEPIPELQQVPHNDNNVISEVKLHIFLESRSTKIDHGGYTQTLGIDYEETFSPFADIRAIRILTAIAAFYDYEIWQMDVKTAFLNWYLFEEVYMEQPEGFVNPKYLNRVCKLKRSIYGLEQALRQWNK
nr:retrovirus-related Pol polyprotein from transposon TNT 1-94 [Tanacetum cinerariifolium]